MFRNMHWAALPLLGLALLTTSLRAEPQKPNATAGAPQSVPSPELSATQRQQIEALRDKTERQLAPLREQLSAGRRELVAVWTAEPLNRAAILKKESDVATLRQKVRQLLVDQRLSYLALLTPAQRASSRSQPADGRMGMACGCMQGGKDMSGVHGGMGSMHGGMGNMHGGMGMGGPGGMPMGTEECVDCMDCMSCEGTGKCAPPALAAPTAPAPH